MRVAVIGAGVLGLSTAVALLDRGAEVTCYDRAEPMSQRSAGSSRIFRLAHGHPGLVRLAEQSRRIFQRWSPELIRPVGAALTGEKVPAWAAAMGAAGAEFALREPAELGLALRHVAGPVLFDPAGGVLDAVRTGEYLLAKLGGRIVTDTVYGLRSRGPHACVDAVGGSREFDACVLAAGAGTSPLAAQVGMYTPSALAHHARFTFPLRDNGLPPPALIEQSTPGVRTYQHLTGPGRWAVGGHFDGQDTAWEAGRDAVVARSRELVLGYVREHLPDVGEQIVEELYCVVAPGGDGFGVARSGGFLTLHGNNLFKLAPRLGELLADAACGGDTPESIMDA